MLLMAYGNESDENKFVDDSGGKCYSGRHAVEVELATILVEGLNVKSTQA